MKNKYISKIHSIYSVVILGLVLAGLVVLGVSAQEVTQGYSSDTLQVRGSIVAQNQEDSSKIETIADDELERMFGVVVRSNDSPFSISEEDKSVFVATKGRFEILVTDVNGEINNGDLITLSPFDGIGMKADERQKLVIATALQDFDVNDPNQILSRSNINDDQGQTHEAAIGRILADIETRPNPFAKENQAVPQFLQSLSSTIAQKPVSATRIYAGVIVLIITAGISASLLYSVVRSAIISVGRNPLSKKSVLRGVIQVIFISILIFLAGLVAVYLIIKL